MARLVSILLAIAVLNNGLHVPGFPSYQLSSSDLALVIEGLVSLLFMVVGSGLSMAFTGFFAFVIADFRKGERPPQGSPEQADNTSSNPAAVK